MYHVYVLLCMCIWVQVSLPWCYSAKESRLVFQYSVVQLGKVFSPFICVLGGLGLLRRIDNSPTMV